MSAATEWPTCGDTGSPVLEPGDVRCVLPKHHEMDGDAWHTDGTGFRWYTAPLTRRYPDAEAVA